MSDDRTRMVRDAARRRWLDAGRPEGRDLEFWVAAEREAEAADARATLDAAAACGPTPSREGPPGPDADGGAPPEDWRSLLVLVGAWVLIWLIATAAAWAAGLAVTR